MWGIDSKKANIKKSKEEIMETIITAIISGLCVAIPSILATISTNKRQNDLVLYRINKLEDKVGQHNNLIDVIPYIKVNGVWKQAAAYMNVNGTWKVGIG